MYAPDDGSRHLAAVEAFRGEHRRGGPLKYELALGEKERTADTHGDIAERGDSRAGTERAGDAVHDWRCF
jgi:hypothetical protein